MMPSRLWLDATNAEAAESSRPETNPYSGLLQTMPPIPSMPASGPVIPPRHSPALSSSSKGSRSYQSSRNRQRQSRRTLPDKSPRLGDKKPEVIGTLIDSFSTISFPDPSDDDLLPPGVSHLEPSAQSPDVSLSASSPRLQHQRSFDTGDYTAFQTPLDGQFHVIDDAAEPPIVRTTKPPLSWGSSSQSKRNKHNLNVNGGLGISNGLESPTAYMSRGNISIHSIGSQDGALSPTKIKHRRRSSLISPSAETFDSSLSPTKRSFRWPSSSPAKPRVAQQPAHNTAVGNELRFDALESVRPTATQAISPSYNHAPYPENVSLRGSNHASPKLSSTKEGKKPAKNLRTSPALGQGPVVPNRRSSLRPQDFADFDLSLEELAPFTYEVKKESTKNNKEHVTPLVVQKDEQKSLTGLDILNGHDTDVTKRIRELKAKKEQRDREARQTPSPGVQAANLTNDAANSEHTKTPLAAKRKPMVGINTLRMNSQEQTNTRERNPSPDRPITPLTPTALPINYSFVVESLSQTRPTNTAQDFLPEPPARPPSRPQSVGGILRGPVSKPPLTKSFWARKETTRRAATPDRSSMDSTGLEIKPQTRRSTSITSRRKRWSQTDLAIGNDIKGRDVQTVYEERPSSQDIIGRAVDRFIHAQRLSQKIRHPTTGRVISFSEVGNPKGNVVFCCVGMGLTRFVTAFYDELASTLNLRLITPDRPGVGDSEVDPIGTPLSWPDDILLICNALDIHKFSLLAHSAGAIYALATALRVPQHIRGKVHLLAPWIPPSQMETIGTHQDPPPGAQLPKSQRFLRVLPAPFLKVANSSFLSATSASLSPNLGTPAARKKKKSTPAKVDIPSQSTAYPRRPSHTRRESIMLMDQQSMPTTSHGVGMFSNGSVASDLFAKDGLPPTLPVLSPRLGSPQQSSSAHMRSVSAPLSPIKDSFSEIGSPMLNDPALRRMYDERLTLAIWHAATTSANPAVDLLVCLERSQSIGFRYVDITRAVVVHHGAKDSRVPVENVKWLGGMMRRCEVRVLEGESHGLMASASVMGGVLTEMAKEWEEWDKMVSKGRVS